MEMPYGKFRGCDVDDLPSGYLKWVAENFKDDIIASKADREWQERERFGTHREE